MRRLSRAATGRFFPEEITMFQRTRVASASCLILAAGAAADVTVQPPTPHAAFNAIPFGRGTPHTCVYHQVFDAAALGALSGGMPLVIDGLAFAPGTAGDYASDVTIRMAYTDRPVGGLNVPDPGGMGVPNAVGPVSEFYRNSTFTATFTSPGTDNFQMRFPGTPFSYDPSQGRNLLIEIVAITGDRSLISPGTSRTGAGPVSSRAWNSNIFGAATDTVAQRIEITYTVGGGAGCYPDCNMDHALNVNDFICFQSAFAASSPQADCDHNSALNVNDFVCFQSAFAAGCSSL
jgi:hypothetical protein